MGYLTVDLGTWRKSDLHAHILHGVQGAMGCEYRMGSGAWVAGLE